MDMTALTGAYTAIKIAKESISAVLSAKVEATSKDKISEALDKLGVVQDTLFYLRDELGRLQTENADLRQLLHDKDAWDGRAGAYKLQETPGGAVVFAFQEEPKHFACPTCMERKEIQILQDRRVVSGIYDCPGCGKSFPVKPPVHVSPRVVRDPGFY